jgi:integrase/recombinase XerD
MISKLMEFAGVDNASSHSFRRTHANRLRKAKASILVIKNQLGHTSLETTQKYLDASPSEQREAVESLFFTQDPSQS